VHRADTASVQIGTKFNRSAFRHVFFKHRKMSSYVFVGVRQMLEYKTIGVAYGRYLCSHLYCHCYHCCPVHCAATATCRVRTSAVGYTVPPPSSQHSYQPCSHHCCREHCASAVRSPPLQATHCRPLTAAATLHRP